MMRRGPGCGCLGCGGTSLVVLGALAFGAWSFVVKPAQDFMSGLQVPPAQTEVAQTGTAQPGATQARAAQKPTSAQVNAPLTKTDVQKFVRIRRGVRVALGTSFSDLQRVWTGVLNGQTPTVLDIANVLRQTAGQMDAARKQQRVLLAAESMSAERYAVVRAAVNRALGVPSVDLVGAAQSLQKGQLPDLNTTIKPASAQEKALVAPFATELRASAAAGLLGL